MTPVTSDRPAVNASTVPFTPTPCSRGRLAGLSCTSASTPHTATSSPSAPPTAASSTLSVSSCRTRRARPAPSARRIAISRCRTDERASSRFATFAQAMSSTQPTAASSVSSAGRTSPTRSSCSGITRSAQPVPAGIVGRILRAALGERVDALLRERRRHAGLQPAEGALQHERAADRLRRKRRREPAGRRPHLDVGRGAAPRMAERLRRDADDRIHVVVDADPLAEDVRIAAEAPLPQRVADDGDLGDAGLRVGRAEHAADLGADAEHREVVRVDERRLDALGLVGLGQVRADRPDAGDVVEEIRAPQVEQLGNRQPDVLHVLRV